MPIIQLVVRCAYIVLRKELRIVDFNDVLCTTDAQRKQRGAMLSIGERSIRGLGERYPIINEDPPVINLRPANIPEEPPSYEPPSNAPPPPPPPSALTDDQWYFSTLEIVESDVYHDELPDRFFNIDGRVQLELGTETTDIWEMRVAEAEILLTSRLQTLGEVESQDISQRSDTILPPTWRRALVQYLANEMLTENERLLLDISVKSDQANGGYDITEKPVGHHLQQLLIRSAIPTYGIYFSQFDDLIEVYRRDRRMIEQIRNRTPKCEIEIKIGRSIKDYTETVFIHRRLLDHLLEPQVEPRWNEITSIYDEARQLTERIGFGQAELSEIESRSSFALHRDCRIALEHARNLFHEIILDTTSGEINQQQGITYLNRLKSSIETCSSQLTLQINSLFQRCNDLMQSQRAQEYYAKWWTDSIRAITKNRLTLVDHTCLEAIEEGKINFVQKLLRVPDNQLDIQRSLINLWESRRDLINLDEEVHRVITRSNGLSSTNSLRIASGDLDCNGTSRYQTNISPNGEAALEESIRLPNAAEIAAPHLSFGGFLGSTAMNIFVIGASHLCIEGYSRYIVRRPATAFEQAIVGGIPIAASIAWSIRNGARLGTTIAHFPLGLVSFMAIDAGVASAQRLMGIDSQSTVGTVTRVILSSAFAAAAPYATVLGVSAAAAGLSLSGMLLTIGSGAALGLAFYAGVWIGTQYSSRIQ